LRVLGERSNNQAVDAGGPSEYSSRMMHVLTEQKSQIDDGKD
jgi:hypothetical protein